MRRFMLLTLVGNGGKPINVVRLIQEDGRLQAQLRRSVPGAELHVVLTGPTVLTLLPDSSGARPMPPNTRPLGVFLFREGQCLGEATLHYSAADMARMKEWLRLRYLQNSTPAKVMTPAPPAENRPPAPANLPPEKAVPPVKKETPPPAPEKAAVPQKAPAQQAAPPAKPAPKKQGAIRGQNGMPLAARARKNPAGREKQPNQKAPAPREEAPAAPAFPARQEDLAPAFLADADYAPRSQAAQGIVSRADALFHPRPRDVQPGARQGWPYLSPAPAMNPLPRMFPQSTWKRLLRNHGQGWYYVGEARQGRLLLDIVAVPGEYQPHPPANLPGFTRFVRGAGGVGYWVRIRTKR